MGNCMSPLFDSMGTCISKCMPKRPNICCRPPKSGPIEDKLVISELPSAAPQPPAGRKNVFSDEFLIACMKNNFHLTTQFVPTPKPAYASRSTVCTDQASHSLAPNSQLAKRGRSSPQSAVLMGPEKVMFFPSCPHRHLPASPSVSRRYTTSTSCASNFASTICSRNITTRHSCKIHEVERVSVPSSCSSSCAAAAVTLPAGSKRYRAGSNLGISSSSSGRKVSKPSSGSGSNGVDCNGSGVSSTSCSSSSLLLRRKEICRHEIKESVVGIKEGSSRLLKRKKSEKAVHPISFEDDIDGDTSSDSLASAIDINDSQISLDCFIFV